MKTLIYTALIIAIVAISLFIGKTTISEDGVSIERPFTAICFALTCLFGILNK